MDLTLKLNQINQIKAENQKDNKLSVKQKTDNQIKGGFLNYEQVGQLINNLPFEINPKFKNAVAKHLIRIGIHSNGVMQFKSMVEKAYKARYPERYLMRCLANEASHHAGGAPHDGSTTILTETRRTIR